MAEQVKLATVQKRGQVTIPIELRRKFGIEEGGIVAVIETEEGILISPREVLAMGALDRIGEVLIHPLSTPIRSHSAFLNSYAPEDEGLYDDYPPR